MPICFCTFVTFHCLFTSPLFKSSKMFLKVFSAMLVLFLQTVFSKREEQSFCAVKCDAANISNFFLVASFAVKTDCCSETFCKLEI